MENFHYEKTHLSQTALFRRGWTRELIAQYLPTPDLEKYNSYRPNATTKLYSAVKVCAIESQDAFRKERVVLDRQQINQQKQELTKYVNDLVITVPVFELKNLYQRACDNYNDLQTKRGLVGHYVGLSADLDFLKRIAVNYLRHGCTSYESDFKKIVGRFDTRDVYVLLKNKILDAIANTYPELTKACADQKMSSVWKEQK